jgi:aryl-alcohol dehydrogenase-like predicted oxidoreductase
MHYTLLGRSGLRVSRFALGTMTFGEATWGTNEVVARQILDVFSEAGGNFLDTSNSYTEGRSEQIVGDFLGTRRDAFVVGTKYSMQMRSGDLNSAGNHRKNLVQSIEGSLRRLGTDYVDVLWVHARETWTPVEEVMRALDDQVRAGKVLYVGASNWPAWEVAEANTLASLRGWTPFVGLQLRYNLLDRTPERELLPMAQAFGMAVAVWGPLAEGRLTGKYLRDDGQGRLRTPRADEIFQHSQVGSDELVQLIVDLAAELECTPAQVALAWLCRRSATMIPVLGATSPDQLIEDLHSPEVELGRQQRESLDELSAPTLGFPHDILRQRHVTSLTYGNLWQLVEGPAAPPGR